VRECLSDIRDAKLLLRSQDFEQLTSLFEGELLVIRAYEAVLEGYYALYLAGQNSNIDNLRQAASSLRTLAEAGSRARGPNFYGSMSATLAEFADFVRAGKPPAKLIGS